MSECSSNPQLDSDSHSPTTGSASSSDVDSQLQAKVADAACIHGLTTQMKMQEVLGGGSSPEIGGHNVGALP